MNTLNFFKMPPNDSFGTNFDFHLVAFKSKFVYFNVALAWNESVFDYETVYLY